MNKKKLSLAFIKRQAIKLKREQNISHTQALEIIAKKHGFSNWMHCQRVLGSPAIPEGKPSDNQSQLNFIDWLKRHKNRNSPLGDLANDMLSDKALPSYNTVGEYREYLYSRNAYYGAVRALEAAWKTYKAYLKRNMLPKADKSKVKPVALKRLDDRKIVYVGKIQQIPSTKRTAEKFNVGDKAWISWDGRKANPVTILEVDERHYTFRIERPLKKAGDQHFLFLDEVRSTPELACMNYVTL